MTDPNFSGGEIGEPWQISFQESLLTVFIFFQISEKFLTFLQKRGVSPQVLDTIPKNLYTEAMNKSFAIIRTEKIKSSSELGRALKHVNREQTTPNADPDRLGQNVDLLATVDDLFEKMLTPSLYREVSEEEEKERKKLKTETQLEKYGKMIEGVKVRKNAIHAVEFIATASPDAIKKMSDKQRATFFEESFEFIKEQIGGEKNILSSVVHYDETTPHLSVIAVPLHEGKLNHRHYLGGSKERLSNLQTEYAERVKEFGLERGIKKSRAVHQSIQKFYGHLRKFEGSVKEKKQEILQTISTSLKEKTTGFDDLAARIIKQSEENKRLKKIEVLHGKLKSLLKIDEFTSLKPSPERQKKLGDEIRQIVKTNLEDLRRAGLEQQQKREKEHQRKKMTAKPSF